MMGVEQGSRGSGYDAGRTGEQGVSFDDGGRTEGLGVLS